ncbi:hypothetical protein, partial [Thiobacillus sp.]
RFVAKGFLRLYAAQHGQPPHGLSMSVLYQSGARSSGVKQRFLTVRSCMVLQIAIQTSWEVLKLQCLPGPFLPWKHAN